MSAEVAILSRLGSLAREARGVGASATWSAGSAAAARRAADPAAFRRRSTGAEIGRAARSRATRVNLAAGAFALLIALFHVWTGVTVGKLGYELAHARELGARLDQQLNELTVEYGATVKPDVLAAESRRRLGLDWPQSGQIVELR